MAFRRHGLVSVSGSSKRGSRGALWAWPKATRGAGSSLVLQDKYVYNVPPVQPMTVANTGWLTASTFTADTGTWTNTANIFTEDSTNAQVVVGAGGEGGGWVSNFSGLTIPSGAYILGIEFEAVVKTSAGTVDYSYVFAMDGISFGGRGAGSRNFHQGQPNDTTNRFTVGGAGDVWNGFDTENDNTRNRDWANTDFTSTFAAYIAYGSTAGATVLIDSVRARVTYSTVSSSSKAIAFAIAEAGTYSSIARRARPAVFPITEVSNYSIFPSRARPVVWSVAETIAYSPVLSRNRALVWSIVESASYLFDVTKSSPVVKYLDFAISEASTYIATALRTRGIIASLSEIEALAWGAFARARDNALTLSETEAFTVVGARERTLSTSIAETSTFSFALARMKGIALALAESANYTFSTTKVKLLLASIDELNTFTFGGIRRTREVVEAINEVLSVTLGSPSRDRGITTTIAEVEVLSEAITRSRALIAALSEIEAITVSASRQRSVATAIAELETLTASIMKVKLLAFVQAQTQGNAFYLSRARSSNITVDSYETIVASFNRARAFVLPIAETSDFTIDIGRLRTQAINIAQTQGITAAVSRLREIIQSIANTTDITFTVTVVGASGDTLRVLVQWTTWSIVSFDAYQATITEVANTEVLSLPLTQSASLPITTEFAATLVVEDDPVSTLLVSGEQSSIHIIPSGIF